ncbi:DedA family protein [Priestia koreensis]|uniref:DedA family protein n=1 Tax=Priestia koreensis TaxID=284581 RepID=UPI001F58C635|nr:DedA family protein [Priestia koreensis]UNL87082.1 DedA family protein [Priestia koreensis]
MNLDVVSHYIQVFGYIVILVILFCGIVGIPAPEESFLVLLGIFVSKHQLHLTKSMLYAFGGVFLGMMVAYVIGYYVGTPFLYKYGKYIGFSKPRMQKAEKQFNKYGIWAIFFGFYIPGIRQLSPYFAGISRYPIGMYTIVSFIGGAVWTVVFILIGYYVGDKFEVMYIGIGIGVLVVIYLIWKSIRRSKQQKQREIEQTKE